VNALTDFEFRVWLYLITYVDDYGRGSADPELLLSLLFPRRRDVEEEQISDALKSLDRRGMIALYEAEGERFFYFPKWSEHQRIQAKRPKFPEPPCSTVSHGESPSKPNQAETEAEAETETETEAETEAENESDFEAQAHTENQDKEKPAAPPACERDRDFDAFWDAYPRKTGDIDRAYFEYRDALDTGVKPGTLLKAIQWQAAEWNETQEARYLPSAEKWLHNRGWEAKKGVGKPKDTGQKEAFNPPTLDGLLTKLDAI
jgi:pyruvate/2-oxoglutarate dehydrogenase complex dihydrolipoamide acyltransferase (E2) component